MKSIGLSLDYYECEAVLLNKKNKKHKLLYKLARV